MGDIVLRASSAEWRAFQDGGAVSVDGPLAESWRRSWTSGVSREAVRGPQVSEREEAARRTALARWPSLGGELDGAARELGALGFVLLLADGDGVLVDTRAAGGLAGELAATGIRPGTTWTEAERGTNAIGVALRLGAPVQVLGAAHYTRDAHELACYATPIFDAWGRVLAVVDATTVLGRAHPLAAALLRTVARSVELRIEAQTWRELGYVAPPWDAARATSEGWFVDARGRVRGGEGIARLGDRVDVLALATGTLADREGRAWDVEPLGPDDRPLAWRIGGPATRRPRAREARPALVPAPRIGPVPTGFARIGGDDPAASRMVALAAAVATSRTPALLLGETGTGKELLAGAIHAASGRGPFVAVNAAALVPTLAEAELFGHAEGAYTGAARGGRPGLVEAANGGTLFLDEVADLPARLQVMLLRFLDDHRFRRVGETRDRQADVRVLAATSQDLARAVAVGAFRSDLWFRLRGVVLTLPPLRERSDRVARAREVLAEVAEEEGQPLPAWTPALESAVRTGAWPGNFRELRTALRAYLWTGQAPASTDGAPGGSMLAAERRALEEALVACGGQRAGAARRLGVGRATLYRMLARHGLG